MGLLIYSEAMTGNELSSGCELEIEFDWLAELLLSLAFLTILPRPLRLRPLLL